jgi:hypothetical protein
MALLFDLNVFDLNAHSDNLPPKGEAAGSATTIPLDERIDPVLS